MPTVKRTRKKPSTALVTDPRLKSYLDATKSESVLLGAVDRYLQLQPSDRDPSVIHPSEMASSAWCHRATWHRLMGRVSKKETLTLRKMAVFERGHDIHDKWQRWLAKMGVLWGTWVCLVCHEKVTGWSNALSGACPMRVDGDIHMWSYREVPLEDIALKIGGRADGVVDPTFDEPKILEIKSVGPGTMREMDVMGEKDPDDMSAERFSKISRPMRSHVLQTFIYLRLVEMYRSTIGKVDRAVVIYEHKSDQQIREFVLTRNDRWTDPLFEAANDIVWSIEKDREVRCNHGGCPACAAYEEE